MLRILHVDDNVDFVLFFSFIMRVFFKSKNVDISLKSAESIQSAKNILNHQEFDFIVLDGNIEREYDSEQLIRHIKENNFPGKIIILSGDHNFPDSIKKLADFFVLKENGSHKGIQKVEDILTAKF